MATPPAGTTEQIEAWFDDHGLPYFTGDRADTVEGWLSSKRIVAVIVLIVGVSVAAGLVVGAAWADQRTYNASVATPVGEDAVLGRGGIFV